MADLPAARNFKLVAMVHLECFHKRHISYVYNTIKFHNKYQPCHQKMIGVEAKFLSTRWTTKERAVSFDSFIHLPPFYHTREGELCQILFNKKNPVFSTFIMSISVGLEREVLIPYSWICKASHFQPALLYLPVQLHPNIPLAYTP